MSLRDKLRVLSQGTEGLTSEAIASEWVAAADALFNQIRSFLAEYEAENLLSLAQESIHAYEEDLGTYSISRLSIRSGKSVVRLIPAGRVVAGALGRIDFVNADMPYYGYMLLRQGFALEDWQVAHRQPNSLFGKGGGSLDSGPIVFAEPLTKASFELALEHLLH
jgi:hypothetical protein